MLRGYTLGASQNPIVQVVSLILVGLALVVAVLMGAVILAAVFGLAVLAAIVIAIRVWWLRRKLRRTPQASGGALIEAEYEVLRERRVGDRERRD
jgi:uncharacterized protein (DUF2062 family)